VWPVAGVRRVVFSGVKRRLYKEFCCSEVDNCTEEGDVLICRCWGPYKGHRSARVVVDLRQLTDMWDVPTHNCAQALYDYQRGLVISVCCNVSFFLRCGVLQKNTVSRVCCSIAGDLRVVHVWSVLCLAGQRACAWRVCIIVECRAGSLLRLEWEKSGAG
jgi:hypothetical protein